MKKKFAYNHSKNGITQEFQPFVRCESMVGSGGMCECRSQKLSILKSVADNGFTQLDSVGRMNFRLRSGIRWGHVVAEAFLNNGVRERT